MNPDARNHGTWRTIVGPGAISLLLGVLLGAYQWLPERDLLTFIAPPLEALALIALLGALSSAKKERRLLEGVLALAASILVLFGAGEAFYRAVFRRGFVPWTDLAFVAPLLNMVLHTEAFENTLLIVASLVLLLVVVSSVIYLLVRAGSRGFRRATRRGVFGVIALAAALFLAREGVAYFERTSGPARREAAPPLIVRALEQITPPDDEIARGESHPTTRGPVPGQDSRFSFPYLRDRDVHFFVVESYGHTVMSNETHRALMLPVYEELSSRLRENGYWSYTGFLVSPAFGGRSWLADATMLTGTFIDSQHKYETAVDSGARNLTHILGDAGYHRVLAAPGTYEAHDEWRDFYQFDQYLFRYDFGYAGPFISFGAMPDQFLIKRANELVAADGAPYGPARSNPLFMKYVLVSSHVPFDRLPVYVRDWSELGDGSIFNELPLREFDNNWLAGDEYPEGYVTSIEYTLTSIVDYVTSIEESSLIVIVGDHQPRIPISEPESSFSVPIHVLSRDLSLARAFQHYGFIRGFTPDSWVSQQTEEHPGMDRLFTMLLDVANGVTRFYADLEP